MRQADLISLLPFIIVEERPSSEVCPQKQTLCFGPQFSFQHCSDGNSRFQKLPFLVEWPESVPSLQIARIQLSVRKVIEQSRWIV